MQELKRRDSVAIWYAFDIAWPITLIVIVIGVTWHDLIALRTDAIVVVSLFTIALLSQIVLPVSYIIEDYKKKIYIDKENQCIIVKKRGEEIRITNADIIKSYHLKAIHRHHGIRGYEYVVLILPERKKVYITNLFCDSNDIISFLSLSCETLKAWPMIDRTIGNAFLTTEEYEDKVNEFLEIFKNHSDDDLCKILRNRQDYAIYAVKAAQILLKERDKD